MHGQAFHVADTLSSVVTVPKVGGGMARPALIVLGDAPGLCAKFTANERPPGLTVIFLALYQFTGTSEGTPTTPGSFTISQAPNVSSFET